MVDKQIVVDVAKDIAYDKNGTKKNYVVQDFLTGEDLAAYKKSQNDIFTGKLFGDYLENFVDGKELVLKLPSGEQKTYTNLELEKAVAKQFRELEGDRIGKVVDILRVPIENMLQAKGRKLGLMEELVDHARAGNVFKTAEALVDLKIARKIHHKSISSGGYVRGGQVGSEYLQLPPVEKKNGLPTPPSP